jgi:uncharacterized LabA/DUF88 family protein
VRTNVYIDGFNLYYGMLRGTLYRWLDVARLCDILLPRHTIHRIRYYTALVRARSTDPGQRTRQLVYLRALRTLPAPTIHEGHFLSHIVSMPLASNPRHTVPVIKTEEKGSDVNLATHLIVDAFRNDFDVAVVVSNDSDLLEPIRIVRTELGKQMGLLVPHAKASRALVPHATFIKRIRSHVLAASQFPYEVSDLKGTFHKPPSW